MNNTYAEIKSIFDNINFERITDHPNILIAARFWDEERYSAAKVCYKFMRMIDDMIDNHKTNFGEISCLDQQKFTDSVHKWLECISELEKHNSLMNDLVCTVERFKIPRILFVNFAKSMIYDINNDGFKTFQSFLEYAEGASVSPASVFIHLCTLKGEENGFTATDEDVRDISRPCAIFSYLVHIIRDFEKDQLNNLNYFSDSDLEAEQVTKAELLKIARKEIAPTQGFRNIVRKYYEMADIHRKKTLAEIKRISPRLSPRYQLSLHIIYELYLQVFERIDPENGSFSTLELNPTFNQVRDRVSACIENFYN